MSIIAAAVIAQNNIKKEEIITNETIVKMVKAKVGDTIILSKIKTGKTDFDLSTDAIIKLKDSQVSDKVIEAMMNAESTLPSQTPSVTVTTPLKVESVSPPQTHEVTVTTPPSLARRAQIISTEKDIYNQSEKIKVNFSNSPGNSSDWICIVPVGSPDTAGGDYKYMPKGLSQGSLIFDRRSPGKYEARAYYNYRNSGFAVAARYAFSVVYSPEGEAAMARKADPNKPTEANLSSGHGLVYIFREPLSFSSSSECQIKANEKPSVFISDSSYFPFSVAAGDVRFTRGETNTMIQIEPGRVCEATINVKSGYVYYLRLQVIRTPGVIFVLDHVSHQEGAEIIERHKLTQLKR